MSISEIPVAVITGAAGGIGHAIAAECLNHRMTVVASDVDAGALEELVRHPDFAGKPVVPLPCDVSDPDDVHRLADEVFRQFGRVDLLFNNAGIAAGSGVEDSSRDEWDWVMSVNFGGVLSGVRAFLPRMVEQDHESRIINMASVAGLISYHPSATYQVSKHAVVALSEHLQHALSLKKQPVGVSVVCPGWVKTRILESERVRPDGAEKSTVSDEERIVRQSFARAVAKGMEPTELAARIFRGIEKKRFYIIPDSSWNRLIAGRFRDIRRRRLSTAVAALTGFLRDGRALRELALEQFRSDSESRRGVAGFIARLLGGKSGETGRER